MPGLSKIDSNALGNEDTGNVTVGPLNPAAYGGKLSVTNAGQSSMFMWNSGIGSGHVGFTSASSSLKLYNTYATGLMPDGKGLEIDTAGTVRINSTGQGLQTIPASGNIQDYRTFTGWNFKYLGFFEFRAGNQYLDIKLNTTSDNIMYQIHVHGYLYNSGQIVSWNCGYTYGSPANSILNQYTVNSANSSITNTYRNSAGSLCLKLNRNNSGYSEGYVAVYFHSFDANTQNAMGVAAFAQNNTAGNYY